MIEPSRGLFLLTDGVTKVRITNLSIHGGCGSTVGPAPVRRFYACDSTGKHNRPTKCLWKKIGDSK